MSQLLCMRTWPTFCTERYLRTSQTFFFSQNKPHLELVWLQSNDLVVSDKLEEVYPRTCKWKGYDYNGVIATLAPQELNYY